MKRYLTPKRDASDAQSVRRVPVEGPVEIYRLDDGTNSVVAETTKEVIDLGVRDAAVSRKKGGPAPVEIHPDSRGIRVHNRSSTNPVSVQETFGEQNLEQGESVTVPDDCIIELGFSTGIRTTVERDRDTLSKEELREKLNIEQKGDSLQGVSPSIHAQMTATALRKASEESVTECRKVLTEMENFVAEYSVDDSDYDDLVTAVEQTASRLKNRADNDLLDGSALDEEWKDELDLLANRVEQLYGRAK